MSQFDRYTKTEYVEALRAFMGFNKRTFLREHGFVKDLDEPRTGRLPRYEDAPVKALEDKVNDKARSAEVAESFGDRYRIARDYKGLGDIAVAQHLGLSRELIRRWGIGQQRCTRTAEVAEFLDVPVAWLEDGGEDNLPANSHIGVRVGEESKNNREQLFGLTQALVAEIPEDADEEYAQAFIEWKIYNDPELSKLARRAGGRWQLLNGMLMFSPWVPIKEYDMTRRLWSDEVEKMIQEELVSNSSVYGAWKSLRDRCVAMGMSEDQYPKKISLHKRVEKERQRAEQFGVNLNDMVAASVAKYIQ
ncbi:hypothetical protein LMG26857_03354 [Achromobacter anxifer]|uniref:helix-turn-helix domain-containing protein n=1 Tax=Achromobacter anxifer TaxID=1287737 RepID=UPI00155BBA85|nr:hypothetical protein [Achromobacter anxifer]CAB5514295.1 hypothetical protein LMG26857_03354 [Achromobacter anxifer]